MPIAQTFAVVYKLTGFLPVSQGFLLIQIVASSSTVNNTFSSVPYQSGVLSDWSAVLHHVYGGRVSYRQFIF